MKRADFSFRNEGTIVILYPHSKNAVAWVRKHLLLHDWQNKKSIAIEPRYFRDIHDGITEAGFVIRQA